MKIKIGTYNIQHCRDHLHFRKTNEELIDPKRVAETVKLFGAEVCALNEVYNQEMLGEGFCNQAKEIAAELGFYYYFAKAIDYKGYEYGNALISRFPITSAYAVPLVVAPEARKKERYEDRVLLIATLDINGTPFTAAVCHFGLSREEQELATSTVLSELANVKTPLVFMGDLNLTPDSDLIAALGERLFDTAKLSDKALLTFPSHAPNIKIDYIFTNSFCKAVSVDVPDAVYADHLPVTAEIEL